MRRFFYSLTRFSNTNVCVTINTMLACFSYRVSSLGQIITCKSNSVNSFEPSIHSATVSLISGIEFLWAFFKKFLKYFFDGLSWDSTAHARSEPKNTNGQNSGGGAVKKQENSSQKISGISEQKWGTYEISVTFSKKSVTKSGLLKFQWHFKWFFLKKQILHQWKTRRPPCK